MGPELACSRLQRPSSPLNQSKKCPDKITPWAREKYLGEAARQGRDSHLLACLVWAPACLKCHHPVEDPGPGPGRGREGSRQLLDRAVAADGWAGSHAPRHTSACPTPSHAPRVLPSPKLTPTTSFSCLPLSCSCEAPLLSLPPFLHPSHLPLSQDDPDFSVS